MLGGDTNHPSMLFYQFRAYFQQHQEREVSQEIKPRAQMQLGHYTLTVKLAEGIFSETWLAEHNYLEGKETCLKIFSNPRFIHHLQKQKFLRTIKDPAHLPIIEDYDPANALPYIAQEVLAGRSLRQLLRERKRLPASVAFELLAKIIAALEKLHKHNLPHLDLRPEHILIDENRHVRLLDYAIGQAISHTLADYYKEFTANNTPLPKPIMRSLLYKSRLHRIAQQLDVRADVFSLGIILFELVSGTYPSRKIELPSAAVSGLPSKVDQIYCSCCGKSEDFFDDCQEIIEAIEEEEITENLMPGIELLQEDAAIVSVTTLAGGKNYVDGKNIGLLAKNLDEIITSKLRFFAFDLAGVDYLNSSAIGFLVNFCDRVQGMGGAMVMFHVDKKVLTILGALGLEKVIQIVETAQQAEERLLKMNN